MGGSKKCGFLDGVCGDFYPYLLFLILILLILSAGVIE
jgi:hypothetical protein